MSYYAGDYDVAVIGAGHAGRPQDSAVPHHERYGQHLQLPHQHGLHPAFQSAVRQGR